MRERERERERERRERESVVAAAAGGLLTPLSADESMGTLSTGDESGSEPPSDPPSDLLSDVPSGSDAPSDPPSAPHRPSVDRRWTVWTRPGAGAGRPCHSRPLYP
jgi:hypothetical protein